MKSAFYASAFGGFGTGSRSRRAQIAESEGKEPASRAAKTWGFKNARALRRWIRACEWHHVGKYANVVEYFDVEAFIEDCGGAQDFSELAGISRDLTARGRELVLMPIIARSIANNLAPKSIVDLQWKAGYFKRAYPRDRDNSAKKRNKKHETH